MRAPPQMHLHTKVLWVNVVPLKIKRCCSELLHLGLLEWKDLLEDGNLFWEVRACRGGRVGRGRHSR